MQRLPPTTKTKNAERDAFHLLHELKVLREVWRELFQKFPPSHPPHPRVPKASPRQNDNICGARLTKGCLCDIIIFNTKQKKGAVEHRRYILVGSLSAVGTDKQPGGSEKNARVGNACACGRNPRVSGGSGQRNGRTSGVQPRRGGIDIGDSPRVLHAAGWTGNFTANSAMHPMRMPP